MPRATADLYDEHGENLQVLAPLFRDFGGRICFEGLAVTLKVFEDNSLVRAALEQEGAGRVLVIDGGGSLRCALVGDQLGVLGVKNGWAGIIVNGCVRDAEALGGLEIGIKALATNPRKSVKKGEGSRDVPVRFADSLIRPASHVYADADGIVVSETSLD